MEKRNNLKELIVIDMQNDFNGRLKTEKIRNTITNRKFTMDTHDTAVPHWPKHCCS